jgi:iron complex outermembrane receptor protein
MGESTVTFNLNWRYIDKKAACNPLGQCYVPGYGLLGGRIDFAPSPDSPWMLSLWGTNMLDKKIEITRNFDGSMGIDSYTPGRPAEFGVEVRRKF